MTLHALDATELGYLRNGTHWSKPGLVFPESPAVFKALVNQTITTRDKISDITYDTITLGAKEDVLPGMTLLVGTTEGGCEVGLCRIRKAASATKLFIGTTSEIYWADNLYLTVIKDYNIWPKRAYLNKSGSVLYMDKDVAYSDQHADWLPFVNMGGDRVVRLTGASLAVVLDASASWVPGDTVAGYAWTTSGGTLADEDTATPTLTVTDAGTYYLDCTVTADNGKTATGHRVIIVLSDKETNIDEEHTYTSQPDGAAGLDTLLYLGAPDTNYGNDYIYVGQTSVSPGNTARTAIRFDISSIPADATITSAKLTFCVYTNEFMLSASVYKAYRLKRDYNEMQATWNSYATGDAWQTAGATGENDIDSVEMASVNVASGYANGTPIEFVLDTAELKKLIDGTYDNYGWLIKGSESEDWYGLHSSESVASSYRPKLVVEYTIPITISANPPISEFELTSSPAWSYERGGWEFSVRMWGQANISSVRDRQKVILFARDFFNGTEISIGQVTGCENIIAVGWIDGETIEPAPDGSSVSFDVRGLHYWLGIETASLMDLDNVGTATAAKWTEIKAMTTDLALCHLLQWRTTINASCDVIQLTGDTRQADAYHEQAVTLWEQISNVAARVLAAPLTDAHNRFCVDIDPQYIPVADRGSLTTIMAVTKPDWRALSMPRVTVQPVGTLHMIGERYITDTDTIQNYYSIANGHSAKRFGMDEQGGTVLAASQAALNTLCGLGMAIRNNQWPAIDIDLAENNRGITGAPAQYISLAVAAGDTPRNVAFSGAIVPRSITHEWDAENNCFLTSISGDAAVTPENAIKEIIPAETAPPVLIPPVIIPPIPPIPEDPTDASRIDRVIIREYTQGIFYTDNFADASPTWKSSNNGLPTIPQSTEQIFVTGNKNLVVSYGYARLDISVDVNDGLWACAPGGTFQKILDYFTVASALGVDGTATIRLWVAVNGIDDTIAVVAQSTDKNEGTRKIFIGSSLGGWTTGVEITRKLEVVFPFTAVGYGDGQWQVISHELLDDYTFVYLISADGSTLTYDSGTTHANFVNTAPIVSIDAAKKFLLPLTNSAKLTDDNGATFSNLAARPANFQGWLQAVAVNTAGDIYMWASDYPLSTDGGANWSEFAAFPGTPFYGSRFFFYGGSEWLATIPSNTGGGVVSSPDDGVTWEDKTGNLPLITEISTFDIREIYGI